MGKRFGYARISKKKMSIDRQVRNIREAYGETVDIRREAFTGTKIEGRKEFEKLRREVKSGDTIIFDSVSRMSRDASIGFELYQEFFARGVELVFLKEPHINSSVYREALEKQIQAVETGDEATDELMKAITDGINRYMMRLAEKQIRIAFDQAEKEVQDLHQRTVEGLKTAVLSGKKLGRPAGKKPVVKKEAPSKEAIRKYSRDFDGSLADADVMKLVGLSRNTYYKYKREMREEVEE